MANKKKTKLKSRKLHPFDREIIASIQNEKRYFDMGKFTKDQWDGDMDVAKCGTASCIAGHIEALRRTLAKRLLANGMHSWDGEPHHPGIAAEIYKRETGKECRLDFFGSNHDEVESGDMDLSDLSRDDAIAHIKGIHPSWPLKGEL